MNLRRVAFLSLLLMVTTAGTAAAQAAATTVQVSPRVRVTLKPNFSALPKQAKGLTEIVRRQEGQQTAYVAVITEKRSSHEEALHRLQDIAKERSADPKRVFTLICGWPALERIYTKKLAHTQINEDPEMASPVVQAVTVAIAEGDSLVRFEGHLREGAGREGLTDIITMARQVSCSNNPNPDESQKILPKLQQQLLVKPHTEAVRPESMSIVERERAPRELGHSPALIAAAASPDIARGPGGGELQIAVSDDGKNVVIGSNSGSSFSSNFADSFSASTVNSPINKGDLTLGTGASGNFYLAGIAFTGAGCSDAVTVSTDKGKTFNLQGNAASCPLTGVPLNGFPLLSNLTCMPDQEQMAVDSRNKAPGGGDQLYMVWRNFTGQAPCTGIKTGNPTPTISCSTDSGKTWTNQTAVGSGDHGRITVGPDGFAYVTYISGDELMINKFSSCAAGLQAQDHFPVEIVDDFSEPDCPVDGQFNLSSRCSSDGEASPQPAVSADHPNHVFVASAEKSSDQNDDIIVRHSADGGLTWPEQGVANTAVDGHRFLPWICTTGGEANVSWYDRRAATGNDDSLTNYFFSKLIFGANPPSLVGGELNVSVNADSQRSATAKDPKFGDYNGNACAHDHVVIAWASATPPPGITSPAGIQVYAAEVPPGPPIVGAVSPASVGCNSSTNITISGSNFYNVKDVYAGPANQVFSIVPLTNVKVVSNSKITATVPDYLGAGMYSIVVTTSSGSSVQPFGPGSTDQFGVTPTITSISPAQGPVPGATAVTIKGKCFGGPGGSPDRVQLYFGGVKASKGVDECASTTQCTVYSPPVKTSGTVDVVVNVDGAQSPTTGADKFTYSGPMISKITPNHGPVTGGTSFWIEGGGFPPYNFQASSMNVSFGAVQIGVSCGGNIKFATNSCEGTTPSSASGPGTVDLVAHAFGSNSPISPGDKFTYDPFPTLINFYPPGNGLIEGLVGLNGYAPNGGAAVQVASSDPSVVKLALSTVTIPAGKAGADVPLTINPTPQSKQVTLTATYQGVTLNAVLNVVASPPLSIQGPSDLEFKLSGNVQVTLNTPAPNGGALVTLTSSDPAGVPVPASVMIEAGTYSKSFPITDGHSGKAELLTISGSYNGLSASDSTVLDGTIPKCPVKSCAKGYYWDPNKCTCVKGIPLPK
jgi:hypothetical protein